MRSSLEKVAIMEVIAIFLAFIIGLFAMIQGYLLLILLTLFLISLSLVCEAFVFSQKRQSQHAIKQIIRAVCIFLFVTYLLFQI